MTPGVMRGMSSSGQCRLKIGRIPINLHYQADSPIASLPTSRLSPPAFHVSRPSGLPLYRLISFLCPLRPISLLDGLAAPMALRYPGEMYLNPSKKEPTGVPTQKLFPNSWSSMGFFSRDEKRQRFLLLQSIDRRTYKERSYLEYRGDTNLSPLSLPCSLAYPLLSLLLHFERSHVPDLRPDLSGKSIRTPWWTYISQPIFDAEQSDGK